MAGIKPTDNVILRTDSKLVELALKFSKIKSTAVLLVMVLKVKFKQNCSFDNRWIKFYSGNSL